MRAPPRSVPILVVLLSLAVSPLMAQPMTSAPAADPAAPTAPLALPSPPRLEAGLDAAPADWRAANQAVAPGISGPESHDGHGSHADHAGPAGAAAAPGEHSHHHGMHHGHGAEARP